MISYILVAVLAFYAGFFAAALFTAAGRADHTPEVSENMWVEQQGRRNRSMSL